MLVDVGTVPHKDAIVKLYVGCEDDPQIGGCCGEISVRHYKPWVFLDAIQVRPTCPAWKVDAQRNGRIANYVAPPLYAEF